MHEITLAKNIISLLEKQTDDNEVAEVKKIYLEIGELHYFEPQIVKTAFSCMPKPHKLQRAEVEIEIVPLIIECFSCGARSRLERYRGRCKVCSSDNIKVISGDELSVKGIEW